MREIDPTLGLLVSSKAKEAAERYRTERPLRIAVLGPGLQRAGYPGTQKRRQIHDALLADGHAPFFPEDLVDPTEPRDLLLEQERRILLEPDVDLVIILHTRNSMGVLMEIANFVSAPLIKAKTAVLFPNSFYTPDRGLPGNTVRAFRDKMMYSSKQFNDCDLVGECRKWAYDRAMGQWPDPLPHPV